MAMSHETLMWKTERAMISQTPQTNTWITFFPITSFESAVEGSVFL